MNRWMLLMCKSTESAKLWCGGMLVLFHLWPGLNSALSCTGPVHLGGESYLEQ